MQYSRPSFQVFPFEAKKQANNNNRIYTERKSGYEIIVTKLEERSHFNL